MSIIALMLPLALLLAGGFVWAFAWMSGDGQFDDLVTPSHRILFDDTDKRERNHD